MTVSVSAFNQTVMKSHDWLKELKSFGFNSEEESYTAMRAVFHSLRDRLTVDGAAHLAAQIPMLIRGMYYEGWKPSATPHKERNKEDFLESVRFNLGNATDRIDPEKATRFVFRFLEKKVSEGEIADVKNVLPPEILELWQ